MAGLKVRTRLAAATLVALLCVCGAAAAQGATKRHTVAAACHRGAAGHRGARQCKHGGPAARAQVVVSELVWEVPARLVRERVWEVPVKGNRLTREELHRLVAEAHPAAEAHETGEGRGGSESRGSAEGRGAAEGGHGATEGHRVTGKPLTPEQKKEAEEARKEAEEARKEAEEEAAEEAQERAEEAQERAEELRELRKKH